jgi:hypothetical protein
MRWEWMIMSGRRGQDSGNLNAKEEPLNEKYPKI